MVLEIYFITFLCSVSKSINILKPTCILISINKNYSYGGDFILEMKDTLYVEIKFWLLMVYTREYTFNQLAGSKIAIEWSYSNKLTNC